MSSCVRLSVFGFAASSAKRTATWDFRYHEGSSLGLSQITYSCPNCGCGLDPADLQQPAGIGGGTYCPKCQTRVSVAFPYPKLVAIVSLLFAIGFLLFVRVKSMLWLAAGTVMLAIPISLFLNMYSTRFKPATLKNWKPRTYKTFFEWLYERDQIRAPLPPTRPRRF